MIMAQKNEIQETARIDALFERISALIEQARNVVVNTAKAAEVKTRYEVGRYIFEDEQQVFQWLLECASKLTWPMHAKALAEQAMKDWYSFEKDWKAPDLEEYSHDHWHSNYA